MFINTNFYQQLPSNPTDIFKNKLDRLLGAAKSGIINGIINQRAYIYLSVDKPLVPTFYLLPKIHKDLINPPGRPIV